MENNKAILDLEKYDELKEFEKAFKDSKIVYYSHYGSRFICVDRIDVIDNLKKENDILIKDIKNLENPENESVTILDLREMSLFNLIKWKLRIK